MNKPDSPSASERLDAIEALRQQPKPITLFFTPDDIEAALRTIRGEVTREEAIVMAAAGAAASAMRTGGRITSKP